MIICCCEAAEWGINMNLSKSGKLLCSLRKAKGMTQKQVADRLGVVPKTVSKWETGHGFPDISVVSDLADILGVSSDTVLSGDLNPNTEDTGNMKKTKFYVCSHCGAIVQATGNSQSFCCGKQLSPLTPGQTDKEHTLNISEVENDFYITFNHEMTKEHFISFIAYVTFDRFLTVKLYPEQDSSVRFPKMYGGKFYYYCSKHGLFEYRLNKNKKRQDEAKTSLTALMSAFSRAYHFENSKNPILCDNIARKLFADKEYEQIESYILTNGTNVKDYVNTQLAPTPIARSKFCEESLETAVKTGTEQYVILGSGFDTFAFRSRISSLSIYEIDKEAVVSDMKRRIKQAKIEIPDNLHIISAGLSSENIKTVLENNGFDTSKKTFFSCLGLFYYMTREEISQLFESIAEIAADGSTIVFDFADNHLFSSNIPRVKEMVKMAEKSGEPMKSCFAYEELEFMLQEYGFLIYEFLSDKDIQKRFFTEKNNELTAFENINYALAVKK